MSSQYQARWVSKSAADALRRKHAFLIDSFNGIMLIEPVDSNMSEGKVLSADEADYELQEVWCRDNKSRIVHARRLIFGEAAMSIV